MPRASNAQSRENNSRPGTALRRVPEESERFKGKVTGFLEIERHDRKYAPVAER